jgi:hypothetical protein
VTIYSTTIDTNDSPSVEIKKPEEYAAATFATYNEELVTADTLTTNDEGYVAAATLVTYNEEFHTDKNIVKGHSNFKVITINKKATCRIQGYKMDATKMSSDCLHYNGGFT